MKKVRPQFIGIGGACCGLSVVTRLLEVHPQVQGPLPCANFFNTADFFKKGFPHYENILRAKNKKNVSGECTPGYLTADGVVEKIVAAYPEAKLFVIVRNPLERAFVEYQYAKKIRKIVPTVSFAQYLTNFTQAQTDGFFGKYLARFLAYYSPLQLHIMLYEDLYAEPLKTMQKLYDFLDLDKNYVPKRLLEYAPPPEEPKHRGRISRLIRFGVSLYRKIHPKKKFGPLLPERPQLENFMSKEELTLFKKTFAADAKHLTNFLYRDMVHEWNLGE